MATILIAWELGGGSGHVVPLKPVIEGLARRGHAVVFAPRDLARAATALPDCDVRLLAAPYHAGPVRDRIGQPHTLAQMFHDVGMADDMEFETLARAWRDVLHYVKPDMMICDHSPTALLAARGLPLRRVVMGFGFICPPDQHRLPDLRPWIKSDPEQLARDDGEVLGRMNRCLEAFDQAPVERITQIYGDADATFLTTFKELDHFLPWRRGAKYWGAWTVAGGKPPQWPQCSGKRVYAYLKHCPALPKVLRWLAESGRPTLAYVDTPNAALLEQFTAPTLRYERERLDMNRVAHECDVAVLHAPHGTTAAMLLAGKPLALLPMFLEQGLMAHAVCRMGAGEQAVVTRPEFASEQLEKVVSSPRYAEAARQFAAKYDGYDPVEANERLLDAVEGVLCDSPSLVAPLRSPHHVS
jgi:hypothetical protein